jgi:hypothetical protein
VVEIVESVKETEISHEDEEGFRRWKGLRGGSYLIVEYKALISVLDKLVYRKCGVVRLHYRV